MESMLIPDPEPNGPGWLSGGHDWNPSCWGHTVIQMMKEDKKSPVEGQWS